MVGETMIGTWRDSPACVGYAEFTARRSVLAQWSDALTADLVALAGSHRRDERLVAVQHLLVSLIEALDPEQIRYRPERLKRV